MLQTIAAAMAGLGSAAFMANRLYVLFTEKKITVKGVIYTSAGEPIYYWLFAVTMTFGLLAGSAIFALGAGALAFDIAK